jgi:hypothetical protein
MLKRSKRRWGSLGKYIVPKLSARPLPRFHEITPSNVLIKLEKSQAPDDSWLALPMQLREKDKDKDKGQRRWENDAKSKGKDDDEGKRGGYGTCKDKFFSPRRQFGY